MLKRVQRKPRPWGKKPRPWGNQGLEGFSSLTENIFKVYPGLSGTPFKKGICTGGAAILFARLKVVAGRKPPIFVVYRFD